jgi:ribulose-phosphate 3-epimerase
MSPMSWREHVRGVEIAPSLYAADFMRLGDQIEGLLAAGCRIFHVDVGDGHFIPPVTIGPIVVESVAPAIHAAGGFVDCHLMVAEPERHFEQFRDAGGDSVTFHVEVCPDVPGAIAHARELGLGAGVAFNPATPVEDVVGVAEGADLLLCMSVVPGYSGQAFIPESLGRLERLRDLAAERVLVQVDGGVKDSNAQAVHRAGADVVVVGSGIFAADDVAAAYTRVVQAVS